jgi:hypothetical protein
MRPRCASFALALALALPLLGCGMIKDPDPTTVDRSFLAVPGETVKSHVYLDEDPDPDGDSPSWWQDEKRDLPAGFDWKTRDVDADDRGLYAQFELRISPHVHPGRYDFEIRFELFPGDWIWRSEYRVRFRVRVEDD